MTVPNTHTRKLCTCTSVYFCLFGYFGEGLRCGLLGMSAELWRYGKEKPHKDSGSWVSQHQNYLFIPDDEKWKNVKWSDEEPTRLTDGLELVE